MAKIENTYAVAVVGLGLYGMSVLRELSFDLRAEVVGIDLYNPPHKFGSSHGETRITRCAIGENKTLSPFAMRSHKIWRELEVATGKCLYVSTGGLFMASPSNKSLHGNSDFIGETKRAAIEFDVPHKLMTSQAIACEYPQFNLIGDEEGYFEFDAGYIKPEACIEAQKIVALKNGAQIMADEKVIKVIPPMSHRTGFLIATSKDVYSAEKVVLTAGPWISRFISEVLASKFEVHREVLYWFEVRNEFSRYTPKNFPVFIWQRGSGGDFLYGFPALDGTNGGIKIATEKTELINPETINREVSEQEIDEMYDYASMFLLELKPRCLKAVVCMYTNTPDCQPIIDWHPEFKNMIIVSACSGHGAKLSAGLGEAVAQTILGKKADLDLSQFSLKRFN